MINRKAILSVLLLVAILPGLATFYIWDNRNVFNADVVHKVDEIVFSAAKIIEKEYVYQWQYSKRI